MKEGYVAGGFALNMRRIGSKRRRRWLVGETRARRAAIGRTGACGAAPEYGHRRTRR